MNISLDAITKPLAYFFGRFHAVIFVVLVVGGLAVAVLILSDVVQSSTNTIQTSTDTISGSSFDQATIERIDKLKTSDDNAGELVLPPGRINPFVE